MQLIIEGSIAKAKKERQQKQINCFHGSLGKSVIKIRSIKILQFITLSLLLFYSFEQNFSR